MLVLEQGRRWDDEDFAATAGEAAKAQWAPWLGMRGIMQITPFRDVNVLRGVGVGGGSETWANTSYVPHTDDFYGHRQWGELADWRAELAPHYATAERMLGVTEPPFDGPSERLMQGLAEDLGVPGSYRTAPVAVFMGEPGVDVADPYFGGAGRGAPAARAAGSASSAAASVRRTRWSRTISGSPSAAASSVQADRRVVDVRPLGGGDGGDGWVVEHRATPPALRGNTREVRARGVVIAGGTLGTNDLLLRCREPRLAPRACRRAVGGLVRTNSESITAATALAPARTTPVT